LTELGRSLADLPMPLGPMVTGLLPVVAIGCFLGAVYAYRRGRSALAIAILVVGIGALIGAVAFLAYASGRV
jgi:hypothetical protein